MLKPKSTLKRKLPRVFINCPFDTEYKHLFEAIRFTLLINGYEPSSTKDTDNGAEVRINKIIRLIKICDFSIHDISRTELHPDNQLPRFNMPLELGLALGKRYFGPSNKGSLLILDTKEFRFQQFISDIGGQDIKAHNNDVSTLIAAIREWLISITESQIQGTSYIIKQFDDFKASFVHICNHLKIDEDKYSYIDYNNVVRRHHIEYQERLLNTYF